MELSQYPGAVGYGLLAEPVKLGLDRHTDSDGVPDSYETSPLGTDPNVFENHAVLDHDGDGYVNIEEWAHSLVP